MLAFASQPAKLICTGWRENTVGSFMHAAEHHKVHFVELDVQACPFAEL